MADPEVLDRDDERGLELRKPAIATTLAELAALKGEAVEIIEARIRVLETARLAAIRATHPEDWLLFKAKDEQGGQVVGYLQDSGCERVRDIFGISIYNVSKPEKVAGADPSVFHYVVSGDGTCSLTAQSIEGIEGGRSSTEDFCKDKTGAALELAVRKAARANLDGQVVRELAGLAAVPVAELETAWTGTHKTIARCRRGRGFGTVEERGGGTRHDAPKLIPPKCGVCGATAVFRTSARGGFFGCPDFRKHENQKWSVDLKDWEKDPRSRAVDTTSGTQQAPVQQQEQPRQPSARQQPQQSRGRAPQDLNAGDIFDRDPGQEG